MTAVFSTVDSDEIFTVEAGGTTYELVCGLEVHAELATADEDVLERAQPLRRRARTPTSTR